MPKRPPESFFSSAGSLAALAPDVPMADAAAGASLTAYVVQLRLLHPPQPGRIGRVKLGQVEADDLGAAQPGAKDQVHDRPVAQRPGVPVHWGYLAAAVAAAVELVEALEPVQHVLDGPQLRTGKGADRRSRKASPGPSSRVTVVQQPGGACTMIQEKRCRVPELV